MHEILDSLNDRPGDADPDALRAEILKGLTDSQRAAVTATEGPVLVLAAAGSGKTRVITRRIAYLLGMGVPPWQILALTFTNKAAGEMRERVAHLLTDGPLSRMGSPERVLRGLTVTTFHALCARLLRKHADTMQGAPGWGLRHDFSIYDSDDQAALVKKVVIDLGMSTSNWPARSVLSLISGAKNDLMDARAFAARATDFNTKTIARIYEGYEKGLRLANAADFDDLLLLTVRMLKESAAAREQVQGRWRYLMIDEYQDTNKAQFVLSTLLVGKDEGQASPNVCVVGDPDQSIYAWRGADISNILDFEETYAGARVVPLGENFRSRAPILRAADVLIRNNKRRKHKDLFTKKPGGEKPRVILCKDERHEAAVVLEWLRSIVKPGQENGPAWKDFAVFYRNNSLSRVMEDALRGAAIPYVIARGTAFYEREEVKDAMAYLRLIANPADDVSLRRIANKPARKIGATALDRIESAAKQWGVPMFEAMRTADRVPDLGSAAVSAVRKFVETVDSWTGAGSFLGAAVPASLHDLVSRVVRESGLEEHYKKAGEKNEEDADKADNLDEVITSALEFEKEYDAGNDPAYADEAGVIAAAPSGAEPPANEDAVPDFLGDLASDGVDAPTPATAGDSFVPPLLAVLRAYLESVALVADADKVDPARGAVTLMTLHAAKGLEFHGAAMIGLEEGLLPSARAMESDPAVEEERRLCFVGITRAMEHLIITSAKYRTQRGLMERTIPSRFLSELPKDGVTILDQSDDSGFGRFEDDDAQPAWGRTRGSFSTERASGGGFAEHKSVPSPFPVGSMVRHPQFGIGRVEAVTGAGANARAKIAFREAGSKTLVLQYARLEAVR